MILFDCAAAGTTDDGGDQKKVGSSSSRSSASSAGRQGKDQEEEEGGLRFDVRVSPAKSTELAQLFAEGPAVWKVASSFVRRVPVFSPTSTRGDLWGAPIPDRQPFLLRLFGGTGSQQNLKRRKSTGAAVSGKKEGEDSNKEDKATLTAVCAVASVSKREDAPITADKGSSAKHPTRKGKNSDDDLLALKKSLAASSRSWRTSATQSNPGAVAEDAAATATMAQPGAQPVSAWADVAGSARAATVQHGERVPLTGQRLCFRTETKYPTEPTILGLSIWPDMPTETPHPQQRHGVGLGSRLAVSATVASSHAVVVRRDGTI